jgi:hypothetical protein
MLVYFFLYVNEELQVFLYHVFIIHFTNFETSRAKIIGIRVIFNLWKLKMSIIEWWKPSDPRLEQLGDWFLRYWNGYHKGIWSGSHHLTPIETKTQESNMISYKLEYNLKSSLCVMKHLWLGATLLQPYIPIWPSAIIIVHLYRMHCGLH